MRVLTFNLNGIRAAWRKGAGEWLQSAGADIVCMQEVRASAEDLSEGMRRPAGLRGEFNLPLRRGYSGVGLLAKKQPRRVVRRFAPSKKESVWDEEGRFLRMDFEKFSAVSLYLPSGSSGDARQAVKETAMAELMPWLAARRKEAEKTGREFLVCGDFNIAHTEKDIRNWRGNRKNSGFLPHEREWLSRLFSETGWTDVFRRLNDEDGQYTWWSNRGRARENNVGWRIDYQIATPNLARRATRADIYKGQWFSDHAPLQIDYRFRL